MAEGTMAGIMEKSGQAKEFVNIGKGGKVCLEDLKERGIKLLREGPCEMHGSQGMLETGMFGRRKDPACALELEDTAKALNPRGIDQIPFCFLPFDPIGHHHVMIDGVCDQSSPSSLLERSHLSETFFHDS